MKKIILSFFIFLLISCSQAKIELSNIDTHLIFLQADDKSVSPRLSLFLTYTNESGHNDFQKIILVHKSSGITWELNNDICYFFKNTNLDENSTIVGTNKITFPSEKVLEGEYQVSIYKLNLETTTKTFSITKPNLASTTFPVSITLANNEASITPSENIQNLSVVLLGADQQPILVKEISTNDFFKINLKTLLNENTNTRYLQFLLTIDGIEFLSKIHKI